ncbi:MAG TPA: DUF1702 family protein [Vicinamibacterales bacterium]
MKSVSGGMPAQWLPLGVRVRNLAFRLSPSEASFARHAFPGASSPSRAHLEYIIETFISGFNAALDSSDDAELTNQLDVSYPQPFLGFAYEGVGLWLAISDLFKPWTKVSRLASFTKNVAPHHDFIAMVGAGFAVARMPFGVRRLEAYQEKLDPFTAWCVADGVGFHDGFFHWRKYQSGRQQSPAYLNPQNRALFDAGVGRSFWWVYGAEPAAIAAAIGRFDAPRRAEMWTGVGTALAYAAGHQPGGEQLLLDLAGEHRVDLLAGIALGANMRHKGGNPAPWTDDVCEKTLRRSVADVAGWVDADVADYLESWDGVPRSMREGCYLALRARLDERLRQGERRSS